MPFLAGTVRESPVSGHIYQQRRALQLTRLSVALIKAIAEKLIPGVPEKTRVSLLQQTRDEDVETDALSIESAPDGPGRTVLEEVIERATSRHEVEKEIRGMYTIRVVRNQSC